MFHQHTPCHVVQDLIGDASIQSASTQCEWQTYVQTAPISALSTHPIALSSSIRHPPGPFELNPTPGLWRCTAHCNCFFELHPPTTDIMACCSKSSSSSFRYQLHVHSILRLLQSSLSNLNNVFVRRLKNNMRIYMLLPTTKLSLELG